jgi:putative membrane-bound dehydrogenase-like protein
MKRFLLLFLAAFTVLASAAESPLRVFIRSGPKSHGPGAHDYPRFLREWVPLLNERGAQATGAETFPTQAQLEQTDVLILHAQEAGNIPDAQDRANLEAFLKRGGGLLVIHAGAVSRDPAWFKTIVGGSWRNGVTKWLEGPMHLYFTDRDNPVTKDCSNWAMEDEIYYDMELMPEARVLATAYTPKAAGARNDAMQKRAEELTGGGKKVSIYDQQPQMWMYERTVAGAAKPYRAFVSIPGHFYANFNRANYRAILLRAIAWAGQRANVDQLCRPDELGDALRYVEGGPTHPSKAAAKIEVHPEFNLSLVAAEPLINKVMAIDWDEKGRLWVAETPEYPNGRRAPNTTVWKDTGSLRPGQTQRDPEDRISILTDTDGDGVMDKKQVFADKLELVTSFVLYRNGVIAASAPDIWLLEDTNGDGVADKRTKLYTGLGIADTHAVINNLRWGQDGWIYATHGYSRGEVTSGDGTKNFGAANSGVVRFKPDGSAFEQYNSRGGNSWGLQVTWDGQVFWTQPTSGTVFFHSVLPESILAKGKVPKTTSWKGMISDQRTYPAMSWPEQAYVQIDQVGRFTAAAGCAINESGTWPAKWNYSYFTGEPTINIVHHSFVRPDGISYTTVKEPGREETEFMRSKDLWFRPIETRFGPDGALYVVDFYNQAVIHNDTRGPLHGPANAAVRPDRDHYFSRIWRVQHKEAKVTPLPVLDRNDLPGLVRALETSPNTHVKQNAWRLVRENHGEAGQRALAALKRPEMGSQAELRYAAARQASTPAQRQQVLADFAAAQDDWTRSALIAAAADHPVEFVSAALVAPNSIALISFVNGVLPQVPLDRAAALINACAAAPAAANPIKVAVLRGLAALDGTPAYLEAATTSFLRQLLENRETMTAAIPLAAKWDKPGLLAPVVEQVVRQMKRDFADPAADDARRAEIATSLLTLPKQRPEVLAELGATLANTTTKESTRAALLAVLGEAGGSDVTELLLATFASTKSSAAFDQLVRRNDSALALVAAIRTGRVAATDLGPANASRLRTHPNRRVAREAAEVLAKANPETKQKDDLIAKLIPEVEKPGDAAKGKALFGAACAICHRLGDQGTRDVGPPLAGMGAHGAAELLVHIIDPNREVDPSFWQWNITTKKGDTYAGVIVNENSASLTVRNQGGDIEVKKDEIATRENTRRSLMPEGLENLGAEGLRDLLTFICGGEQTFRVLDLRAAYTADSRRGMFRREDANDEGVTLHRFGNVTVQGVPFFVMDPAKSPSGRNVVALKGGPGQGNFSSDFPAKVSIAVNASAASLHFLGGVGGWAWPSGGEAAKGRPALKVTVTYADDTREEQVLKNGEHFADYIGTADVPMSVSAGDFTRRGQLRYFALNLGQKAVVKTVELESFGNTIVPCTVAVTAGLEPAKLRAAATAAPAPAAAPAPTSGPKEGGKNDRPLAPVQPVAWETGKLRVLVIGGGSSHDFTKFFGETDGATLRAAGFSVLYTEDRDQAAAVLPEADVAVVSVNRMFFDTPAYRKALMAFAAAGKGLVMLHPGTWYAFPNWPELNAKIVGGGARGHDKIGKYTVNAVQPAHPVLKGVPATFEVEDELYYINAEPEKIPAGTAPITVLAQTSPSIKYKQPHPAVWVTQHEKARIVGLTLGHDQRVHDLTAYKTLLVNAVKWTAGK